MRDKAEEKTKSSGVRTRRARGMTGSDLSFSLPTLGQLLAAPEQPNTHFSASWDAPFPPSTSLSSHIPQQFPQSWDKDTPEPAGSPMPGMGSPCNQWTQNWFPPSSLSLSKVSAGLGLFLRCEPGEAKQGNLCYFSMDWWGGNHSTVCKGQSLCNHTFCMGESHFCDRGNKGVTGRWNSNGSTSACQVKSQIATLQFECFWEGGFKSNFCIFMD